MTYRDNSHRLYFVMPRGGRWVVVRQTPVTKAVKLFSARHTMKSYSYEGFAQAALDRVAEELNLIRCPHRHPAPIAHQNEPVAGVPVLPPAPACKGV